ncbi:hypothetical protein HPB48_022412 [Haemaphysalis longicornis]|uniref:Uncharacterized protein n=1 Tax=Haemaphysalis longicornis TaxID=44386 RepID=A0A9J6GAG2_HAELO|nr:hypothetical protein HPB48_022412 [Haemaphysalis longicornis]
MAGKKRGEVGRLKPVEQAGGVSGTPKQGGTREGKQSHKSEEFVATSESEQGWLGPLRQQEQGRGEQQERDGHGEDFPSLPEAAEEEELSSAEGHFLRQLMRAQATGLEEQIAAELLSASQTIKEIAQRRATKVAGVEGEVRGLSHQLDRRPAGKPSFSQTAQDAAEQISVENSKDAKQKPERKETKAIKIESTDHQAIAPTKVMRMVQRTFNPQKLSFKEVLLRPTSKGVAVVCHTREQHVTGPEGEGRGGEPSHLQDGNNRPRHWAGDTGLTAAPAE